MRQGDRETGRLGEGETSKERETDRETGSHIKRTHGDR